MFYNFNYEYLYVFIICICGLLIWSTISNKYTIEIPTGSQILSRLDIKKIGNDFALFSCLDLDISEGKFFVINNIHFFKTRFSMFGIPRALYAFVVKTNIDSAPQITNVIPDMEKAVEKFYGGKIEKLKNSEKNSISHIFGIPKISIVRGLTIEKNKNGYLIVVAGKISNPNFLFELEEKLVGSK